MSNPICLKTGYRGKTRPSCIFVHRPDLTGRDTYDCPTCGATWYRIPGAREAAAHPDQNWTRNASVVRDAEKVAARLYGHTIAIPVDTSENISSADLDRFSTELSRIAEAATVEFLPLEDETLAAIEAMLGIRLVDHDAMPHTHRPFMKAECAHGQPLLSLADCHDCSYVYDKFELCL